MKPKFIDYVHPSRRLSPEQKENARSALKEIGRVMKGKKVIFVYAREYKGSRCAT